MTTTPNASYVNKPVVIIPARAGSKRFPNKNIILWEHTERFIKESNLFGKVYVSSDSEEIKNLVDKAGSQFVYVPRHPVLCGDEVAVKPVIQDVVSKFNLYDDVVCMMYLTSPERDIKHFEDAISRIRSIEPSRIHENYVGFVKSLMSFYESDDTPYLAKYADDLSSVIKHNFFRHQDYRKVINYTHYICMFEAEILHHLDDQLFNERFTKPHMIYGKPVDIDYKEQYDQWLKSKKF